jgi:H/ACA ribonucleoprotein complex subunit 3
VKIDYQVKLIVAIRYMKNIMEKKMHAKLSLHKCPACGIYTMKSECYKCRTETEIPKPARFSPEDKYGHYRRKLKKMHNIIPGNSSNK